MVKARYQRIAILPISMAESGFGEQQIAHREDYALAAKRCEIIEGDEGESHTSYGTYARKECF